MSRGRQFFVLISIATSMAISPVLAQASGHGSSEESAPNKPKVYKESDRKTPEEQKEHVFGDGISASDIVEYAAKMRPVLRYGKTVDIVKTFKVHSSMMREIDRNHIRVLNLEDVSFSGDDLSRSDFTLSNLKNANFSGANLEGAVLAHCDLDHADFAGANLKDADLSGAILTDANFKGAIVQNTNFYKADVRGISTLNDKQRKRIEHATTFYRVTK